MRQLKAIAACLLAAFSLLCTVGCDNSAFGTEGMLRAPRADGVVAEIRAALKKAGVTSYTLKTPREGDHLSAYILHDTNGDGKAEGVVFYSVKEDKQEMLHFAVVTEREKGFEVASNTVLDGTDIESVAFGDLNGDGNLELCIARSIYGAPETRLSVYQISREIPVEWYEGGYTDYRICDMNGDSRDELVVFGTDKADDGTSCTMLAESGGKLNAVQKIRLNENISDFKDITETTVDGAPALFVDAYDGEASYFTEIIAYKNGKLCVPLYEQSRQSSLLTSRYQNVLCGDIDGDDTTEIPCMTALPTASEMQTALYVTDWKEYSGGKLQTKEISVISKQLQYRFVITPELQGRFSCVGSENDGMDFYEYTTKNGFGSCIFKLCAVNSASYTAEEYADWFTVGKTEKTIYLAAVTESGRSFGITEQTVADGFRDTVSERK